MKEDIRIEQLLESETNQESPDTKFGRVDLLALNGRGELIIIEVQNQSELDYFHRILSSSSRVLVEQLILGEAYEKVKKIYSVNIVYFDMGQGQDYVYRGTTEFKGVRRGDTLLRGRLTFEEIAEDASVSLAFVNQVAKELRL